MKSNFPQSEFAIPVANVQTPILFWISLPLYFNVLLSRVSFAFKARPCPRIGVYVRFSNPLPTPLREHVVCQYATLIVEHGSICIVNSAANKPKVGVLRHRDFFEVIFLHYFTNSNIINFMNNGKILTKKFTKMLQFLGRATIFFEIYSFSTNSPNFKQKQKLLSDIQSGRRFVVHVLYLIVMRHFPRPSFRWGFRLLPFRVFPESR